MNIRKFTYKTKRFVFEARRKLNLLPAVDVYVSWQRWDFMTAHLLRMSEFSGDTLVRFSGPAALYAFNHDRPNFYRMLALPCQVKLCNVNYEPGILVPTSDNTVSDEDLEKIIDAWLSTYGLKKGTVTDRRQLAPQQ